MRWAWSVKPVLETLKKPGTDSTYIEAWPVTKKASATVATKNSETAVDVSF